MLIEFGVENFRSLRDHQILSMVRSSHKEMAESNTFQPKGSKSLGLLRSAAIYGPNAGGKSNLMRALQAMQRIVVESASKRQRGDQLPIVPFRLDAACRDKPSLFEVSFIVDTVRYQYGFTATAQQVHDEWLLAYPKGRAQRWFERRWNDKSQTHEWEMGNMLTGEKQLWQRSTRDNALFLSTAVQLNSTQLKPLFDWFQRVLRLTGLGGWSPAFTASLHSTEYKQRIIDFLQAADLDIVDFAAEAEPFNPSTLPPELPPELKSAVANSMEGKETLTISTMHYDTDGNPVAFDLGEESDGTKKLFAFAGPWIDTLEKGYVLFIDELHDNLHPKLVRFLVELFHSDQSNPKNAQLIFTTHDTSILTQEVYRRDQIWFCEKGKQQASTLYPLTDFSPRKNRENLEMAYLSGRYGALPFVRELKKAS